MNMRIGVNIAKEFNRLMKHGHFYGCTYSSSFDEEQKMNGNDYKISNNDCCTTNPISFMHKIKVMNLDSKDIMWIGGAAGVAAFLGYACGKTTSRRNKSRFMDSFAGVVVGTALRTIFSRL